MYEYYINILLYVVYSTQCFPVEHIMCSIHTLVCGSALPLPSLVRDGHLIFLFCQKSLLLLSSLSSYWHQNAMWRKPKVLESTSGLVAKVVDATDFDQDFDVWGFLDILHCCFVEFGHFFYGIAVDRHNHSSWNSSLRILDSLCHGNGLFCWPFSPA